MISRLVPALCASLTLALLYSPALAASKPPAGPAESDWRTPDPQNVLVIDTTQGRIIF